MMDLKAERCKWIYMIIFAYTYDVYVQIDVSP